MHNKKAHFNSRSLKWVNSLRRMAITLVTSLTLSILSLTSAQAHEDHPEAIAGAMAALDDFMLTFNRRDMDSWAATLNYPHVRLASGAVTIWQTQEEYAEGNVFARLGNTGWDHSHWLSRDVVMAAADKVHIQTVFRRFDANNEPIGTYHSLYVVTLENGKWGTQARSSLAP